MKRKYEVGDLELRDIVQAASKTELPLQASDFEVRYLIVLAEA